MKRNFALVLTALMLVFSLTACGGRGNNDTTANNGSTTTEDSTNTDRNDGGLGNAVGDAANGVGNAVGDVANGMENAVDDVLPGDNNSTNNTQGGVTYGDMLENGTVEDTPTATTPNK